MSALLDVQALLEAKVLSLQEDNDELLHKNHLLKVTLHEVRNAGRNHGQPATAPAAKQVRNVVRVQRSLVSEELHEIAPEADA